MPIALHTSRWVGLTAALLLPGLAGCGASLRAAPESKPDGLSARHQETIRLLYQRPIGARILAPHRAY